MPSLKSLVSEVKDPNDYDGVVLICTKGNQIANLGFTGKLPQGIDQKVFLYRLLQEAQYALTFSENGPEEIKPGESPKKSNLIKH
jgi:hypothetical protein